MASFLILSSHNNPQLTSPINHQVYASRHGYDYLFDSTPYPGDNPFDQKLLAMLYNSTRSDWTFWLDEDAYILDQSIPLTSFLPSDENVEFAFCKSPVTTKGDWTILNSGVYFMRNSDSARALLREALEIPMSVVREWWIDAEHGAFTNGDQDKLVYTFSVKGLLGTAVRIFPKDSFNSRVQDFVHSGQDHFVCHFCGHEDKQLAMMDLRKRFGLDAYLLPIGSVQYPKSLRRSAFWYFVDSNFVLAARRANIGARKFARRILRRG